MFYLSKPFLETKTRFGIRDSGFEILDYGFLVSGTWIPDFNRYTDSKALDSGVQKQNFSGFQSPDFLT